MTKMNEQDKAVERGNQAPPKRTNLYAIVSRHAPRAIEVLVQCLDSRNEPVKMAAAKTLLAKVLPDIKAEEISGKDGQQLTINLIRDYIATVAGNVPTSGGGLEGPLPVQGADLAPEGTQDINVTREDGTGVPQPAL